MIVPCPKCGGDSDDTGSKYVCGECYWVFDKGAQVAPSGGAGGGGGIMRGASAPAAPAYTGPTMCPKCSGKLLDISGKMVCEDCYHVIDQPAGARPAASSFAPQPQPAAAARPAPQGAQPAARPAQAPAAMPTACPKCGGKLVDIGGKPVCEACFHVVDEPAGAPRAVQATSPQSPQAAQSQQAAQFSQAPQAPHLVQPQSQAAPNIPQNATPGAQNPAYAPTAAQQPQQAPAPQVGAALTTCPKCNGNLVSMAGALVCESCYHTVDIPGATPPAPAPAPGPGASPMRPTAPSSPSNFAMPSPAPPPTLSRNNFKTQGPAEGGEMSPQMIGGIVLILMLIMMIVVLAIKH